MPRKSSTPARSTRAPKGKTPAASTTTSRRPKTPVAPRKPAASPKPKTPASSRKPAHAASYTPFSTQLTGSLDTISRTIKDNAGMIDMIQEVALELTGSIGSLHTLTVRYAGVANRILDVLLPIITNLPIIPQKVKDLLTNLERVTQKIIDNQESTSRTIDVVQTGLRMGDVASLHDHAGELRNLTRTLGSILPEE